MRLASRASLDWVSLEILRLGIIQRYLDLIIFSQVKGSFFPCQLSVTIGWRKFYSNCMKELWIANWSHLQIISIVYQKPLEKHFRSVMKLQQNDFHCWPYTIFFISFLLHHCNKGEVFQKETWSFANNELIEKFRSWIIARGMQKSSFLTICIVALHGLLVVFVEGFNFELLHNAKASLKWTA